MLTQGYQLKRIAIINDHGEGYTVAATYICDGVEDRVLVSDRMTWDEMVAAVISATFPRTRVPEMFYSKELPSEAARAMRETGRL